MPVNRDQVLAVLKQKGPSLPAEMTSELKENTIIVGAFLSELTSNKLVKITKAKIGGSPLYYLPEHHHQITRLYPYLNEKDKKAFDLLQESKVLRDDELTPLLRTCLRNLPDFAMPITVRTQQQEILFWRWFMVSMEQAQQIVSKQLQPKAPPAPMQEPLPPKQAPPVVCVPEKSIEQKETKKEQKKAAPKKEISSPVQKTLASKPLDVNHVDPHDPKIAADKFYLHVVQALAQKNIQIQKSTLIKNNAELDLIVKVPSAIGNITYFAKARKKKTCNDGDIAAAVLQGQHHRLPVLFICSGKVTKKVQVMLNKEFSSVMLMENIGD